MIPGAATQRARAYLDAARPMPTPSPLVPEGALGRAAVIGSGTMGGGIAMALANAGFHATLVDRLPAQLERAAAAIGDAYASSVRKGRLSQTEAAQRQARLVYTTDLAHIAELDFAVEAVFEDLALKCAVLADLDRRMARAALLATNTSTLDIDAIAAATTRPERVLGLHFFSPAHVMPLLEIVPGRRTSAATLATARQLGDRIGKIGVVAGNSDGFIGNRMLYPYRREAEYLLEEGATPAGVDRALREFGFAMGPFAAADLAGLDIGWHVRKRRNAQRPSTARDCAVADRLCELGRFGQKTGAGYFRYVAGDRTPHEDPIVDKIICETARAAGIARRAIGDEEIVKRCVYTLVNEGAAILAAGTARRASDIDLVWVHGYGFPAARGGPMYYARALGFRAVVADMLRLEQQYGQGWAPCPLLVELAAAGADDFANGE